MAELYRYAAFISYSSKDAPFARKLHQALERYSIPSSLGKFDLIGGGKQNRIYPVFRDREELSAGQLGEQIEANLRASAALIVVCSPNGAASPWVQKEIEYFVGLERRNRVFTIIPDGAPLADESGADCTPACFPSVLRGGEHEPLAADARLGRDGFRVAWLKLVAGMIGVSPGQLIDRDTLRRRQQRFAMSSGVAASLVLTSVAAALVDARSWRSDFTAYANERIANGGALDAMAFALAGLPARGDVIGITHQGAQNALSQSSAEAPVIMQFGQLGMQGGFRFSPDGRFLVVRTAEGIGPSDGIGTLYDLDQPATPPLALGQLDSTGFDFSENSRFLITKSSEFEAWLYDLSGAEEKRALGKVRTHVFSRDGRFLATDDGEYGFSGNARLYDLNAPDQAPLVLGELAEFAFSPDDRLIVAIESNARATLRSSAQPGTIERHFSRVFPLSSSFVFSPRSRFVAVQGMDRNWTVHNLGSSAASFSVGPTEDMFDVRFSRDERFLAVKRHTGYSGDGARNPFTDQPLGQLFLYDLSLPSPTPLNLSPVNRFSFYDGFLYVDRPDGKTALYALDNFDAPPRLFDTPGRASISPDERFMLAYDEAGAGGLYPLDQPGRPPVTLAGVRFATFSPDGRFFAVQREDAPGSLFDLTQGTQEIRALPQIESLSFSENSRFLAIEDAEQNWSVLDLAAPDAPARTLGRVQGFSSINFGGFGNFAGSRLFTQEEDGHAVLRDLALPAANTGTLRAQVCGESADTLRPFSRAVRSADGSDAVRLARQLHGRPWNPCDWRGMLAIFPNASRGDGWFEGWRQWLRLMHVRHFGGRDYACEETTSAASAETRARRLDMCERFAPQPEPAPAPAAPT